MRTFLAIEIPENIKEKLAKQIIPLRRDYPQLNWVPPENYHVTVHFYGEVGDVKKLTTDIEDVLFDVPAFRMYSLGAGIFIDKKILLYTDFQRVKVLEELAEKVKSITEPTQQNSHRYKFIPHLTIARSKIPSKQQYLLMKKKLEQFEIDLEFPVDHVTLYQSILEAQAPIYKKIVDFPLFTE